MLDGYWLKTVAVWENLVRSMSELAMVDLLALLKAPVLGEGRPVGDPTDPPSADTSAWERGLCVTVSAC
jgi:hypothetical protein